MPVFGKLYVRFQCEKGTATFVCTQAIDESNFVLHNVSLLIHC